MLHAYFDESERATGVFCIAGYVFAPAQAAKFSVDWSRVFGSFGAFHMVDLVARRRKFKDITDAERHRLIREAVNLINRRMAIGVAASCDIAEVRRFSPRHLRGFSDAYPVCAHLAMTSLGNWLTKQGSKNEVFYTFEAGHKCQAEANDFINTVVDVPEVKASYRYIGHEFVSKNKAQAPLESADLFAWEFAKFQDETRSQRVRPIRGSLLSLFAKNQSRYVLHHFSGRSLAKYLDNIRRLELDDEL